jgi:hypothetical protein
MPSAESQVSLAQPSPSGGHPHHQFGTGHSVQPVDLHPDVSGAGAADIPQSGAQDPYVSSHHDVQHDPYGLEGHAYQTSDHLTEPDHALLPVVAPGQEWSDVHSDPLHGQLPH